MSAQSHFFCKSFDLIPPPSPVRRSPTSSLHLASSSSTFSPRSSRFSFPSFSASPVTFSRSHISVARVSNSKRPDISEDNSSVLSDAELDRFAAVGNALADASGEVIRKYFRKKFDIVDKDDMRRKTGDRRVLDWASRYRIAVGAAREIAYLHHDCIPHIIHRDIKSSNILLDHNMEARVCDIGLATFCITIKAENNEENK